MKRRPLMVMGCSSNAGKSFLVAALCRYFANRGQRVAPFKAQNMSNNAAVCRDGAEIGRAQYLQALAARVEPQARMNPILLKPMADTASQVIVMGRADPEATRTPWLERKARLWPTVRSALHSLVDEFDLVVIEGAGSPAEVNLHASDMVNTAVALEVGAQVHLAVDIDRCGAFAHLYGTWSCLEPQERALLCGFVLNKFRGDPALLGDAPRWLEERTGVPTVAIVPLLPHALPEEDTLHHRARTADSAINLALIAYPYASNLDEFDPLVHEPGVRVVPVRDFTRLADFHAILLPGSKHTAASLRHLRETGLAGEVARAARSGVLVLGVCGGLQLLGESIADPDGVEGGGEHIGLGLLGVSTALRPQKTTRQRTVEWSEGGSLSGYEIHHGVTQITGAAREFLSEGLGFREGNVLGVYLHGLFENTAFRQSFLARLGWQGTARYWSAHLDSELDRVARCIEESGWARHLPT